MINRPGGAVLSVEEAARFTEDERDNLRSWGIGVPEPPPHYPDEETPIPMVPRILRAPRPRFEPTIYGGMGAQQGQQTWSAQNRAAQSAMTYQNYYLSPVTALKSFTKVP